MTRAAVAGLVLRQKHIVFAGGIRVAFAKALIRGDGIANPG
jgi:hypothetical protein